MIEIDWKVVVHYAIGIGLIFLGVLGELHVPGIDPTTCFSAGAAYLAGGVVNGHIQGSK